jgi:prepilin-type N-terminal cleavage/methylation domain-containing protein
VRQTHLRIVFLLHNVIANGKIQLSQCGNEKLSHLKPRRKKVKKRCSKPISLWLACFSSLLLNPSPLLTEKAIQYLGWLPSAFHRRAIFGYTLAELLIALAVLAIHHCHLYDS